MNPWHWVVRAIRREPPLVVPPYQVGDTVLMTANGYTQKMRVAELEPFRVEPWDDATSNPGGGVTDD